jgi:hypothetical protein
MATIAARPRTVEAEINYLGKMDSMPFFYARDHERDNLVLEARRVTIADARQAEDAPRLDRDGFELVRSPTGIDDFTNAARVAQTYPRETEALIRRLTGADHVAASGAVLRFSERDRRPEFVNSLPARFVHVDYSRASFERFAATNVSDRPDREKLLRGRYIAYNIWRVLSPPPQDVPLAICAATSVGEEDRVTGEARVDGEGVEEFRFGSSLFRPSPRHLWFYFRDMSPDEALVFKAFDSDRNRFQGCPHVAFDDPSAPADAPPRASVEIRAFAYWRD